ncbi:hypothetical protein V8F44DRAFT_616595 [Aspergillus fumigatus]
MINAPKSTALVGVYTTPADYERQDATEDEINKLPHIADSTSSIVWIALVVSGAEWFLFYATTTPWREFSLLNSCSIGMTNIKIR